MEDLADLENVKDLSNCSVDGDNEIQQLVDSEFEPKVGMKFVGIDELCEFYKKYSMIAREDTETFVWLFGKWLECMNGCALQGIITDQDRAMKNAIEIVFPNTRHRWCLWHIMNKQSEKLGRYNEYEAISSAMKKMVYDMQRPDEFEKHWREMIETYDLEECEWLSELYKERNRWVPCYVKNIFWAGMSTTQRSESMNAFFDGYVNSKISLKQFVEQYENALRNKVEKETRADAESFSKQMPTVTNYMMERQVQKVYTLTKFKEFQAELTGKIYCETVSFKKGSGVIDYLMQEFVWLDAGRKILKFFNVCFHLETSEVQCSCQLFESKGILCRHALVIYIRHDVNLLPDKYILRRWRKDVRRAHSKMKVKFNSWENTPEESRYRKMCIAFSEVADLAATSIEETDDVNNWIENKFKKLQLIEKIHKSKQVEQINESPEAMEDEELGSKDVLDPLSQSRKGRPRKNRIKPTGRRTKKKTSNEGNVTVNKGCYSQVGVETSTQGSMVSYPHMLQPWGAYQPAQYFPYGHSFVQFQMPGHPHSNA